jgi:hypothetical protein
MIFENLLGQKKESRDANIMLRLTESQKSRITAMAQEQELNTSQFILSLVAMYEASLSGGADNYIRNNIALPEKKAAVKPASNAVKTMGKKEAHYQYLHEMGDSTTDTPQANIKPVKYNGAKLKPYANHKNMNVAEPAVPTGKKAIEDMTTEALEKLDDAALYDMFKGESTGAVLITDTADYKNIEKYALISQALADEDFNDDYDVSILGFNH